MKHALQLCTRAVTGAFGAVALLGALVLVPSAVNAADAPWENTFNLGTISKPGSGDRGWNPEAGGRFQVSFGMMNNEQRVLNSFGAGEAGTLNGIRKGTIYSYDNDNSFRNNYNFSLDRASSLNLNLQMSKTIGWTAAFEKPLTLALTGSNGFHWEGTLTGTSWENIWGNLGEGSYTLSISGTLGARGLGEGTSFIQGYGASFSVGAAQPGDVPLPGALLLLGTALAGAGVYGRKKITVKKAA